MLLSTARPHKSTPSSGDSTQRISIVVQQWFLAEPLLFASWSSHRVLASDRIATIRVADGQIEFCPTFVNTLDDSQLREVMKIEAVRIVLLHPYQRRKPQPQLAWEASNLSIVECLPTSLPIPNAKQRFSTSQHDHQFFEYYYQLLDEPANASASADPECSLPNSTLDNYCNSAVVGVQNSVGWGDDTLRCEQIQEIVADIEASKDWGTVSGRTRESILASQAPRLDYRRVLRAFRAKVLATTRRLTRMKPSRRYGFDYMGSRRDFTTSLLFAIDTSGSVNSNDIRTALSIINRLFKYGVESVDVIYFDSEIQNEVPVTLKRAQATIEISGRGGTNFQPLMDYLDTHRTYDGMIVFTDGFAPVPIPPKRNRRTRIAWLLNTEANWKSQHRNLRGRGMVSAFVKASRNI